jgi:uncharacterized protein (TIGR02611 family)
MMDDDVAKGLLFTIRTGADSRDPRSMNAQWREEFEAFKRSEPGHRFRERFERMKAIPRPTHERIARCLCGIIVMLVGIVLIPLPGPGWLIVGFGVTLLAQESRRVADFCDRIEIRSRAAMGRWRRWRAGKAADRRP